MNSLQPELLRLQVDLQRRLSGVRDARKAVVYGLRATREMFGAREAAMATLKPGRARVRVEYTIPSRGSWDEELLTEYATGNRPPIPRHVLLAPVERRGRKWAVVALRDPALDFSADHREALFFVARLLTDRVRTVDRNRLREVRRKIERKIADRQEPKDLMYDILHGLRSLTRYDHSASLFIAKGGSRSLELVAEQIAWTKAKSKRIGLRVDLDEALTRQLRLDGVRLYERSGDDWKETGVDTAPSLPGLLGHATSPDHDTPPEAAMLCAPVAAPDGTLGVLKISARRRNLLSDFEAQLVEEFMPLASLVIQFSVRTETLRTRILQSEKKHAVANLTRGIAHDVNNALGATLPLVQQLRRDAQEGQLEPADVAEDLGHIEKSIQTCRRVFGGMLAIARGGHRSAGFGNLRRAVDSALSVLEDSMKRQSIDVVLDLPDELPALRGGQGDLTQVFLNLCTNARDAMPEGGTLTITARIGSDAVEVLIGDTGCGIPAEMVDRVSEPFFSTKADGNGLGLSICRSVLWDVGGKLDIETTEGQGTSLRLRLPVLPAQEQPE